MHAPLAQLRVNKVKLYHTEVPKIVLNAQRFLFTPLNPRGIAILLLKLRQVVGHISPLCYTPESYLAPSWCHFFATAA
jgi:hypothetical protein